MTSGADEIRGQCLCGAVRVTVHSPPRDIEICHCNMCRRWSGSFYPAIAAQQFTLEGEDSVSIYRSSDWAERAFCTVCGSNLWFRFLPTGNRSFLAGLFDLPPDFAIEREIFIDEKPDWYDLGGDRPKLTRTEILEEAKKAGFTFD